MKNLFNRTTGLISPATRNRSKHRIQCIAILSLLVGTYASRGAVSISQQAYLKASNTGAGDSFGMGLGISGDTLIVGAKAEDSNASGVNGNQNNNSAPDSGAAYIFVRNGTNWVQQAYLKPSNTKAGDYFGVAGAVSGDTVIVGAPRESSNATGVNGDQKNNSAGYAGAAYVFVRTGTNWTQQAYLKASNTGGGDYFGNSVAISGDTIVVGAASEDRNAAGVNGDQSDNSVFNAGAAYIFVRRGTNWQQQAYLKASNPGINGEFGSSVAISGDTVVIGAEGEASNAPGVNGDQTDQSAAYAGAVYVFVRTGTNWTQQAYLKASNPGAGDEFGLTLGVSGGTIIVGAHHEDSDGIGVNGTQNNKTAEDSGSAYVFVRTGTNWTQQAYLKASNAQAGIEFGDQVALSGDVAVVATGGENSNATGVNGNQSDTSAPIAGAAYVFFRTGTTWIQQAYLKASNTQAYDEFGARIAVSGDTVVVGADGESSNATGVNGNQTNDKAASSGAAYIFTGLGQWRPELALEQAGANLRILWPLAAADFVLDQANNLDTASMTNWSPVQSQLQTNATHLSVTLPLTAEKRFYRLRRP